MSDDKEICWRLHLCSAPEKIFRFLTTDDGREKFWAEASRQTGEKLELEFINGVRETATILETRPPHLFRFKYFGSEVSIELKEDGQGGTDLTLLNCGVSNSDYLEMLAGWLNVLFPLKAAVDHGVDLRNHDPARSWNEGYVDQ